jgi:hypothetical protein
LPSCNVFCVPKICSQEYAYDDESGKILISCYLKDKISWIMVGLQYDRRKFKGEEDDDQFRLALIVSFVETFLRFWWFWVRLLATFGCKLLSGKLFHL